MDDFQKKKVRSDIKLNRSLIRLRQKVKKRAKKKQKGKQNFKKSTGISQYLVTGMEGVFFKGLRSDYISRKALKEASETRRNEDINKITDAGKFFLQKEDDFGRCLKRIHHDGTDDLTPEKSARISNDFVEDLEHCPLSPIRGRTVTFVADKINSTLRIKKRYKHDLEKEFRIFSQKYDEAVGNEVLLKLPKKGVLEEALNALRKILKRERTGDYDNVTEEFQGDEIQFSEGFRFSAKDFELKNPEADGFIKNSLFSDNLLVPEADYYESFGRKSWEDKLLSLDDEYENYHPLSFQSVFRNVDDNINTNIFACQGKNFENSAKSLSITTPPIQFYRRNMF